MRKIATESFPNLLRHYRSNTHWYIPHDAGQLSITLEKVCPQAYKYMPNITTYYHGTSSKTTVTITSEEAFTEALASATNNILYYDPGEITV